VTVADEYLTAATLVLRDAGGDAGLDTLGWWQLVDGLADRDSREAVFALFRAQGRTLASSRALGGLMAQPYAEMLGLEPGSVIATVPRDSPRHGPVHVIVGDPGAARLLIDRPGRGVAVVDAGDAEFRPVVVPGRLVLHEVDLPKVQLSTSATAMGDAEAAAARQRSAFLGRTALALEILGAAEGAVELAVEHARAREQFGAPIGTFQAVRHLLAWATADCTAVERVVAEAVALDVAAPPRYGDIAKALAGRNGRRACERALQVLGGVGFTAEHDHHHFHSRALALDSLLGASPTLTRELGAWRREERGTQQVTSAMLLAR